MIKEVGSIMKKGLLYITLLLIIIISTTIIGYNLVSGKESIQEKENIIAIQTEKESYLTPYGYTLDNPNIVKNPYGISPLTALILFETKEEQEVTITIPGIDPNSTYTNTFEKSTIHSIPVYGLYPNKTNQIILKCGDIEKTIEIKTNPLPQNLIPEKQENNSNDLYFITDDNYPYALDNNNEVRWYLTKNYVKKISRLSNGNLLLSNDIKTTQNNRTGLVEVDLLGKVHKEYNLDKPYYGTYTQTENSLLILSNNIIEIETQTNNLIHEYQLNDLYTTLDYDFTTKDIILKNKNLEKRINKITKQETIKENQELINEHITKLNLYNANSNYKLTPPQKITTTKETPPSKKNILLLKSISPNQNYQKYQIKLTKTEDYLIITGQLKNTKEVYLILDKFLNKKIYQINHTPTIINSTNLKGKYSIYIKIEGSIYKTNQYVEF